MECSNPECHGKDRTASPRTQKLFLERNRFIGGKNCRCRGVQYSGVIHSGNATRRIHGTGFIVHKHKAPAIFKFQPISERVLVLRLNVKPFNMTIVQVYAPTSEATHETLERFHSEVNDVMSKLPIQDVVMDNGDWYVKIGTDAYSGWLGTIGRLGLGKKNDQWLILLEFARTHNLSLLNTFCKQKLSRKASWHSPNGKSHNLIDYLMVDRRFLSSFNLMRTRTFPGADIGSDHDLVLTTMNLRLKRLPRKTNSRVKYYLDKLKNPETRDVYQVTIGGKFAPLLELDESANELCCKAKEAITTTADEIIGKKKKLKSQWMTPEILGKCDHRRLLKARRFISADDNEAYRAINKKIRKDIKVAKEQWVQTKCAEVENDLHRNNTKSAYQAIKLLTKPSTGGSGCIEDKAGTLLTEKAAIANWWHEFCSELYNYQLTAEQEVLEDLKKRTADDNSYEPHILEDEVSEAVKTLKHGKSPGVDNIPAELLVHGGLPVIEICNKVMETGEWPDDWTTSIVLPLPKKGNSQKCEDHRTISFISHASKIQLKVLLKRLQPQQGSSRCLKSLKWLEFEKYYSSA
ncbi:uncharacterized protein LOC141915124 [Tubulanus polymorphus]|uniref:uncharacterized protein LOC141915124 n=1 Tax=Tubulanus polymorphus TaxID=672921 RepID=UPI003DA36DD8